MMCPKLNMHTGKGGETSFIPYHHFTHFWEQKVCETRSEFPWDSDAVAFLFFAFSIPFQSLGPNLSLPGPPVLLSLVLSTRLRIVHTQLHIHRSATQDRKEKHRKGNIMKLWKGNERRSCLRILALDKELNFSLLLHKAR